MRVSVRVLGGVGWGGVGVGVCVCVGGGGSEKVAIKEL